MDTNEKLSTTTKPPQPPKASSFKYIAVILFIVLPLIGFYIGMQYQKSLASPNSSLDSNVETTSPSPSRTISLRTTLYRGIYKGEEVLAYQYSPNETQNLSINYLSGEQSPTSITATFEEVTNKQSIHEYNDTIFVADIYKSLDKNLAYVSIMEGSPAKSGKLENAIYLLNLEDNSLQKVWANNLANSAPRYDTYKGLASIKAADGEYLVLAIEICFECSPYSNKQGLVVANTSTDKEQYLGFVGNVSIDIAKGTYSYQELESTIEPCSESGVCFDGIGDGKQEVFKPAGQLIVKTLP